MGRRVAGDVQRYPPAPIFFAEHFLFEGPGQRCKLFPIEFLWGLKNVFRGKLESFFFDEELASGAALVCT